MFVSELMSRPVVYCTPWDTAQTAADLMKTHGVGAIPVILDKVDPLLEGMVTDRDLCCNVVAGAKNADAIEIAELMTRVPVSCEPDDTLEFCEELMRENQIRRIPVVDKRGRCIGIVAQADIALHAPPIQVARTLAEISKPSRGMQGLRFEKDHFYCGQPHEMDEILLLNRRRERHNQEGGTNMMFTNRTEAGQALARQLRKYANRHDVIVLGVPRGGVPVAFEVATALRVPLDVFVLRKLGVPGHEELAFGAIGSGGVRVLDPDVIEGLGLSQLDIELVTSAEKKELKRRESEYRGGRHSLDVSGLTVILVDDGIATGSSIRAAIRALRQMKPARIVIATPVAPASTCNRLRYEVDELVCVDMPESFFGVGQFYRDFLQVSDEEVNELLDRAARQSGAPVQDNAEPVPGGAR
jgi:putative phosphoribosyl transferase